MIFKAMFKTIWVWLLLPTCLQSSSLLTPPSLTNWIAGFAHPTAEPPINYISQGFSWLLYQSSFTRKIEDTLGQYTIPVTATIISLIPAATIAGYYLWQSRKKTKPQAPVEASNPTQEISDDAIKDYLVHTLHHGKTDQKQYLTDTWPKSLNLEGAISLYTDSNSPLLKESLNTFSPEARKYATQIAKLLLLYQYLYYLILDAQKRFSDIFAEKEYAQLKQSIFERIKYNQSEIRPSGRQSDYKELYRWYITLPGSLNNRYPQEITAEVKEKLIDPIKMTQHGDLTPEIKPEFYQYNPAQIIYKTDSEGKVNQALLAPEEKSNLS